MRVRIGTIPGKSCCRKIEFRYECLQAVVTHRRGIGIKRIGFDDVGARVQELAMNVLDNLRACQ